jgi:hypothetical protein
LSIEQKVMKIMSKSSKALSPWIIHLNNNLFFKAENEE